MADGPCLLDGVCTVTSDSDAPQCDSYPDLDRIDTVLTTQQRYEGRDGTRIHDGGGMIAEVTSEVPDRDRFHLFKCGVDPTLAQKRNEVISGNRNQRLLQKLTELRWPTRVSRLRASGAESPPPS